MAAIGYGGPWEWQAYWNPGHNATGQNAARKKRRLDKMPLARALHFCKLVLSTYQTNLLGVMSSVVTVIKTGTETAFFFCKIEPNQNHGFMPLY